MEKFIEFYQWGIVLASTVIGYYFGKWSRK